MNTNAYLQLAKIHFRCTNRNYKCIKELTKCLKVSVVKTMVSVGHRGISGFSKCLSEIGVLNILQLV